MEDFNAWLSFPIHESLNHDLAIRRFCPARLEQEQEQGGGEWEELLSYETEFSNSSSYDSTTTTTTPCLLASQVNEFVDSFINMDQCNDFENENDHHQSMENQQSSSYDYFQEDSDDLYGDLMMMMEGGDQMEIEDFGVVFDDDQTSIVPSVEEVSHGVDQGLHLVHMLLACAEAVGCRDTRLAQSLLAEISSSISPFGDSLQRVSYFFAEGLKSRLSLLQNVNLNGTFNNDTLDVSMIAREEKIEAFQLLYQTTPYVAFGFMVANEAICQASQGKERLHIIDLGMEHTLQWPSLLRTLASRPKGPPKKLRITGLVEGDTIAEVEERMRVIVEEASSLGIPMEFNLISEMVTPSLLTKEKLDLREGEALCVNSIMHLHKYVRESRGSLKAILQALKKLSPSVLTLVEQDANHNGPFFLGRFLESLHFYSAIFDSLEVSLPSRNSSQRMKIERHHFADEIRNIVAFEGLNRVERHERADQWRRQLGRAGFQVMGLKCTSQARMMLSVYGCDGYSLASEKGCLLLGWKGRPIMLAAAWQVNNTSSS